MQREKRRTAPVKATIYAAVIAVIAAAMSLAVPPDVSRADENAVALVRQLYRAHARAFAGTTPPILGRPAARAYFDARAAASADPGRLGFDPLYNGQDAEISRLRIASDPDFRPLRGTAFVRVTFRNFGQPNRLVFVLKRNARAEWRIVDIETRDWTLSEMTPQ